MDNGTAYMNMAEVCQYLGIVRQTVARYVTEGRLRAYKVGKTYRFRPEDLETFLSGADAFKSSGVRELRAEKDRLQQRIQRRQEEIERLSARAATITRKLKKIARKKKAKPKRAI